FGPSGRWAATSSPLASRERSGTARPTGRRPAMLNERSQAANGAVRRSESTSAAVEAGRPQAFTQTSMRVTKRNGQREPVDVNKIVRAVSRCCTGLAEVDALRVATKTISGLYDGATTSELDQLSIRTAAALIAE